LSYHKIFVKIIELNLQKLSPKIWLVTFSDNIVDDKPYAHMRTQKDDNNFGYRVFLIYFLFC